MYYPLFAEEAYNSILKTYIRGASSVVSEHLDNKEFTNTYRAFIRNHDAQLLLLLLLGDMREDIDDYIASQRLNVERQLTKVSKSVLAHNKRLFTDKISNFTESEKTKVATSMFITSSVLAFTGVIDVMIKRIHDAVQEHMVNSRTVTALRRELKNINASISNRIDLISVNEVSRFNTAVTKYRSSSNNSSEYIWITRRDNKVRTSHAVLDGKVCSWLDEAIYREKGDVWRSKSSIGGVQKHVGEDFNCRCEPTIIVTEVL